MFSSSCHSLYELILEVLWIIIYMKMQIIFLTFWSKKHFQIIEIEYNFLFNWKRITILSKINVGFKRKDLSLAS